MRFWGSAWRNCHPLPLGTRPPGNTKTAFQSSQCCSSQTFSPRQIQVSCPFFLHITSWKSSGWRLHDCSLLALLWIWASKRVLGLVLVSAAVASSHYCCYGEVLPFAGVGTTASRKPGCQEAKRRKKQPQTPGRKRIKTKKLTKSWIHLLSRRFWSTPDFHTNPQKITPNWTL